MVLSKPLNGSNLPARALFQYLQLKHAYMTQAQMLDLTVHGNYLLERILKDPYTKGIISMSIMVCCLLGYMVVLYRLEINGKWKWAQLLMNSGMRFWSFREVLVRCP